MPDRYIGFVSNTVLSVITIMIANMLWVSGFLYANDNDFSPFESSLARYTIQFIVYAILFAYRG